MYPITSTFVAICNHICRFTNRRISVVSEFGAVWTKLWEQLSSTMTKERKSSTMTKKWIWRRLILTRVPWNRDGHPVKLHSSPQGNVCLVEAKHSHFLPLNGPVISVKSTEVKVVSCSCWRCHFRHLFVGFLVAKPIKVHFSLNSLRASSLVIPVKRAMLVG